MELGDLMQTFIDDNVSIFTCTNNMCAKEFSEEGLHGLKKREITE